MATILPQVGARAMDNAQRIFRGIPASERENARIELAESTAPERFLGNVVGSNLFLSLVKDRLAELLDCNESADLSLSYAPSANSHL